MMTPREETAVIESLEHAEVLLRQARTYMQQMLAATPALSVARDSLCDQIRTFLGDQT